MSRKLLTLSAFASLAFTPILWAAENSNASLGVMPAELRAMVTCHGISNIPVTADKLQSLPLKVVATLQCGDQVLLLSKNEEYTSRIRTAAGKDGYIASMFLEHPAASTTEVASEATVAEAVLNKDGIVRWHDGDKGSAFFYSDEKMVESLTANGVTVQVALQDTGWKLRALVAIANNASSSIEIPSSKMKLGELKPRTTSLSYQDPEKIAKAASHQVLWSWADAAPTTSDFRIGISANAPPSSVPAYRTLQPVNYLTGLQEADRSVTENALSENPAQIRALALHDSSLKPNDKVAGAVWFARDGRPGEMVLQVPVGDMLFEFSFSF